MSKNPSILHIIDSLEPGGAEKVAVMMVNLFSGKGHEVGLMYFIHTSINLLDTINNDVQVYQFDRKGKFNILQKQEFQKITMEYDLLHVHLKHNLRYVWFMKLFSKRIPTVVFHDHGFSSLKHLDLKVTKAALTDAVYISVNESLSEIARKKLGVKTTHLLENTIETIETHPKSPANKNDFKLVLVSNIHPRKNILFAIEFLAQLVKEINSCKLDIIGNVIDSDYYEICVNIIRKLSLSENIKFIHGESYIQPLLANYDLGLHVSPEETGPLVLLEYFSQGIPFLSYKTGQVSKKANQNFPSFFIENFEISNWVEGTIKLRSSLENGFQERIKYYFYNNYSTEKFYNNCLNIYLENLD